ncbi:hypothetical protein ACYSUW_13445 [Pseudomonas frederiksbergensis]
MPFPIVSNIQFVLRRPSISVDHITSLAYGLITASDDLPDQSIFPIALTTVDVAVCPRNSEMIADRLTAIGYSYTDLTLHELNREPIFRSLQVGHTGGEIAVYATEIPAPAGQRVYAFIGLWRGDAVVLEALADRRHCVDLRPFDDVSVGDLDLQTGEPYTFTTGGVPSDALRKPIWDSVAGRVGLHSIEPISAWRRRMERRSKILSGEAEPQWDESIYRDQEFRKYLSDLAVSCPDLVNLSWHTADQKLKLETVAKQLVIGR